MLTLFHRRNQNLWQQKQSLTEQISKAGPMEKLIGFHLNIDKDNRHFMKLTGLKLLIISFLFTTKNSGRFSTEKVKKT
jgi:hypothetical protein